MSKVENSKGKIEVPIDRFTGTILFYKTGSGYGFIKVDNSDAEIFFHHTEKPAANKKLLKGQKVTFLIGTSQHNSKGDVAKDIQLIEE